MHLRGDVITLDPSRPRADGIVVRDGAVAALDGAGGEPIPAGAVILPGFTDSHVHLLSWSSSLRELALSGRSREAVLALVGDDRSDFVRGYGWSAEDWPEPPTRAALDAVSGDRPVALLAHDWHSLWVNSAALALAREPLEVPGGVVERDASGEPTGILREESAWAFRDRYALPTRAETLAALEDALPLLSARGVVAVHDKDGMLDSIDVVRELRARVELPIRIRHSIPANRMDEPGAEYVKAFMDGTLGSRTARLIGGGGVEVTSRATFEQIVRDAAARGLPTAVHAIGDQAVRDALDAFEASRDAWAGLRQRIEHAQCVHPDDLARFAALDITASIQPAMAITDETMASRIWADRIERAYAYGSLHRAGARLAGGSDAPVEALDPLDGIRAAVLRTWRPAEALDLDTALHAWTTVPAYLEGRVGQLARGTLADLTILDRDPYIDLAGAQVIGTVSQGAWTFRAY